MSWSYKKVGPNWCTRQELRIEARGIPGMQATCCEAGMLSHLLQYKPAAHCSVLWHLTQTARTPKISSLISLSVFKKAFGYRISQVVCHSAAQTQHLEDGKTLSPGSDSHSDKLYSANAALYSSQHASPCVTCRRIATIIDDRGEDCYA